MYDWRAWGSERKANFEATLTPDGLQDDLERYGAYFEEDFGMRELLELRRIQALALIAEAVNDAPEFLLDQIGIALSEPRFQRISNGLESIAEAIEGISS